MSSQLTLHQLELWISLGKSEVERAKLQKIFVDISLRFKDLPKACISDEIDDTISYSDLTRTLKAYCVDKSFKLLEHFTYALHQFIKEEVGEVKINVTVTKHPPTPNLDHCTFTIHDE